MLERFIFVKGSEDSAAGRELIRNEVGFVEILRSFCGLHTNQIWQDRERMLYAHD